MAKAPQINSFSGTGPVTELALSTNQQNISFSGTVESNIIDIQININNSGFKSDPSLVSFLTPNFTVPNLQSLPNGLPLIRGKNTIQLRAIDISGAVSPVSSLTVNQVSVTSFQEIKLPPTGVTINRKSNSVEINWFETNIDSSIIGYNLYASTGPGGTDSGYLKLNAEIIPASTVSNTIINEFPINDWSYDYQNNSVDQDVDLRFTVDLVNSLTNEVLENKSINTVSLIQSPNYRYSISASTLESTKRYVFSHNRNDGLPSGILNSDVFSAVPNSDPLYYVLTALYLDPNSGDLQESGYSPELSGSPLPFGAVIRGIKIRDQRIVSTGYIEEIQKKEPTLSLIPGSSVREVHIEPFSNEIQKAYFLLDFVHRSKSFEALISIDDPSYTGTSVPVSQSQYKQNLKSALSINDDTAVQSLIDGSFDSLASNYGVTRQNLKSAQVVQTFYTYVKPTRDMVINQGAIVGSSTNSNAPRFSTKAKSIIPVASSSSFYNPEKKRYEIKVQLIASIPGSTGNVPANSLDTVISGANGFSTINEVSASFGFDKQSNLSLAEDGMKALLSLDSGTYYGYEKTAKSSAGVLSVKVVESGDPEMMRDYDTLRGKHAGGKVDVYVKGAIERTVTETFAFQFQVAKGIRFEVLDPINLIFRAKDSRLSVNNPINEMLFSIDGYGLRNHSVYPIGNYDLTGCIYVDYQTIQLNKLIAQPSTTLDDFIEGDYRYRSNNKFVPTLQPVRRITSIIGEVSGSLEPNTGFVLYKTEDPMLLGESVKASDYITVNQINNIPSGDPVLVNNEIHTIIGQIEEPLSSIGINLFTIRVYSLDRTTEYNGPNTDSPDYLIVPGSQVDTTKIIRSTDSTIPSGSQVSIDYEHDENFKVTYVINDVLQNLSNKYKKGKHATADVLVKQSVENQISADMTVVLRPNSDQSTADQSIRTNISRMLANKKTGQSAYQSDFVAQVEASTGVDYVVQPFTKLTLKDGSLRVRDSVLSDYDIISSLSQFSNQVFILTQELPFSTSNGGGNSNIHRGVYKDDFIMDESKDLISIGVNPNRFYIIGNQGDIIIGYSDDSYLKSIGITDSDLAKERIKRTANRVVVSLDVSSIIDNNPSLYNFSATYSVSNDKGSKDLQTVGIEYLTPGEIDIVYKV